MNYSNVTKFKLLAFFLLLSIACYSPVEYEIIDRSRIVKLRVSDNSIVASSGSVTDGRSLCSIGNNEFMVASGNGTLYRFNSEEMQLDTSFVIGFGSGSGYGSMITPKSGSIYVIGAAGKIIEISLQSNSVIDEFEAGPMPNGLCASPTTQRFYVSDGSDQKIREIDPVSNTVLRTSTALDNVPVSIIIESFQNKYLLAASSSEEGIVERITLGTFHVNPVDIGKPSSDITAAPAESIWAVVHPEWFQENGSVSICGNFSNPEIYKISVDGHPTNICSVPGSTLFYALSYLGDGLSRITAINYFTKEIEAEIDIPGFPWDITSHANGEYILTLTSDI